MAKKVIGLIKLQIPAVGDTGSPLDPLWSAR